MSSKNCVGNPAFKPSRLASRSRTVLWSSTARSAATTRNGLPSAAQCAFLMDLAASVAFVAEPAEADLMRRPPRDPKAKFLDRSMVQGMFGASTGLFAAVCGVYLATWYSGAGLIAAQTMAFATWLLGHVLLALNLRSEREPLFQVGFFTNWVMVAWATATVSLLLVATLVPGAQQLVKVTSLHAAQWALAVGAAFAGTFWIEARKLIRSWRSGRGRRKGIYG